jgi:hypothetical protein
LAFVAGFQVALCLAVGCVGVSVVWCAMAGWMLTDGGDRANAGPPRAPQPRARGTEGDERGSLLQQQHESSSSTANCNATVAPAEASSSEQPASQPTGDREGRGTVPDRAAPGASDAADTADPTEAAAAAAALFPTLWRAALAADAAAVLYYAWAAPPVTTLAHLCAAAMGALLRLGCGDRRGRGRLTGGG